MQPQRDGNAKVRDAVEVIHRSIQRIDNPLMIAGLISHDPFFAIERVRGKFFEKQFANQILSLNIDLQFDVVSRDSFDALTLLKIFAQQFTGGAGGVLRCIEILLHREALRRTKNTKCTTESLVVMLSEVETSRGKTRM